jgi:hypothetical protein
MLWMLLSGLTAPVLARACAGLCFALEGVAAFMPPACGQAANALGSHAAAVQQGFAALQPRSGRASSLCCAPRGVSTLRMSGDKKKAVIVGAGPAGLLAAHLLLKQKPGMFDVTVAETRADPRASEQASLRSYSLGLGVRGRTSIKRAGDAVRVRMPMCVVRVCACACACDPC